MLEWRENLGISRFQGCALACVAGVLILVMLGSYVSSRLGESMDEGREDIIATLPGDCQILRRDGKLGPDHRRIIDRVEAAVKQEGITFSGAVLCSIAFALVNENLDGMDQETLDLAKRAVTAVEKNPRIGLAQLGKFRNEEPQLAVLFTSLTLRFQEYGTYRQMPREFTIDIDGLTPIQGGGK